MGVISQRSAIVSMVLRTEVGNTRACIVSIWAFVTENSRKEAGVLIAMSVHLLLVGVFAVVKAAEIVS